MAENQITINLDKSITVTLGSNDVTVKSSSISVFRNYLDENDKLYFDGDNGNTYLTYNSTLDALELYVNGSIKKRWS